MFQDRVEAGRELARAVSALAPSNPVVLALPRGGVPLGVTVAERLRAPLDLMLVRKIGMPGHAELAAGAVAEGDPPVTVYNREILTSAGLTDADFEDRVARLVREIGERRARYLPGRSPVELRRRTAILVDDGIATGATVRVAIRALRARQPDAVWVAVPVAPQETVETLRREADRVICLSTPDPFRAVGAHYRDFRQVTDDEVVSLMAQVPG